jgi:hypothetical protein
VAKGRRDADMSLSSTPERLSLGRVVRGTFASLGANAQVFLPLAFVLGGAPTALASLGSFTAPATEPFSSPIGAVGFVVSIVASLVLQGAIVSGVHAHLSGARPTGRELLSLGLRRALPLFGLALLSGLAIGFGMLLLIVPGLILASIWSVAVPALIIENKGVGEALERSSHLTRGVRGQIILLMLLYTAALLLVFGVLILISTAIMSIASNTMGEVVYGIIAGTAVSLWSPIGSTVLYHELLALKGEVAGKIDEVFA